MNRYFKTLRCFCAIGTLAGILAGCGVIVEYKLWTKPGASLTDIKKSLLECGARSPGGSSFSPEEVYLSHSVEVAACMEAQGYVSQIKLTDYAERDCVRNLLVYQYDLPACRPGAKMPEPSVERRLNSQYCQAARRWPKFPLECLP